MEPYILSDLDFSLSFGTTKQDIHEKCGDLIKKYGLSFMYIENQKTRDALITKILKRIEADTQCIATPERKEVWQNGWQENLDAFIESNYNLNTLTPKFFRSNQPVRFRQQYVLPHKQEFELKFFCIFRQWLFKTYLSDVSKIYEFGCGTGFNLVALAKLFPSIYLWGSDFVQSSCDLVDKIAKAYQINLKGYLFDMIKPNIQFIIRENSAVFTIGAIEQLGGKFYDFIDYLIQNKPKIVIHCEPVLELYDTTILEDYLAYMFQKKRGYTIGLLPHLKKLENQGRIRIEKIQRLYFGSLFMEGYNLMVWRPL